MNPELEIDDREFRATMRRIASLRGKPLRDIVRQSARRVAVNLAKGTAPVGDGPNVLRRGQASIRRDVSKVFISNAQVASQLDEEERKQLAWLQNNKGPAAIRKFLAANGINVQPLKAASAARHNAERRRGRIPKGAKPKYMIEGIRIKKLADRLVRRALRAKNGWAMAARQLGGSRGLTSAITASKGPPRPTGTASEMTTKNSSTFTIHNHVDHVSELINRRTLNTSLRNESRTLARELQRAIKTRARRRF